MHRIVLYTLMLMGSIGAAEAEEADFSVETAETYDYWTAAEYEDTPGAEASTWAGVETGSELTRETSLAILTVYFTPGDGEGCSTHLEVRVREFFPRFEQIELQVDTNAPHLLTRYRQDEAVPQTTLVLEGEALESALSEFGPGSFATARVFGWEGDEPLAEHTFILYGFKASTEDARARCEQP